MSFAQSNSYVMVPTVEMGSVTVTPMRYDQFVQRLYKADSDSLMKVHAALGLVGEVIELREAIDVLVVRSGYAIDAIKKAVIYNKNSSESRTHIVEELGDIRFYIQAICQMFEITEQEILQANADKLAKRYVQLTYTDEAANLRADKQENQD